jgi:hypothetical protein
VFSAVALANFRTEGDGAMTGVFSVHWTVEPTSPPQPWKHCSSCGDIRPFRSSGKIRLNANGRKLDAWLIYKCAACARTWNRPIAERAAVAAIAAADLQAMQRSEPAWVRVQEFDLAALKRYCDRIELPPEVSVAKTAVGSMPGAWSTIVLTIDAPRPTGQRLDRLLASELQLSRSALQSMHRAGALQLELASRTSLKKLVGGRIAVRFIASKLAEEHRMVLAIRVSA